MFVRLVLAGGSNAGMVAEIKQGFYLVGRHQECQIRSESQSVSDRHCLLQHEGNFFRVFVLDDDSLTLVNHKPLDPKTWVILNHGDLLQVGRVPFLVAITAKDPSTPVTAKLPKSVHAAPSKPSSDQPDDFAKRDTAEIDYEAVQKVLSESNPRPESSESVSDPGVADRWKKPEPTPNSAAKPARKEPMRRAAASQATTQPRTVRRRFKLPPLDWRWLLAVVLVVFVVGVGIYGTYSFFDGASSNLRILPEID